MSTKMIAVFAIAICSTVPASAQFSVTFGTQPQGKRVVYFNGQGSSTQWSNHQHNDVRPIGYDRNTWQVDHPNNHIEQPHTPRIGRTMKKIVWEERTREVFVEEERTVPRRVYLANGQTQIVTETVMVRVPQEVTYRVPVEVEVPIGMPTHPGRYEEQHNHNHDHNHNGFTPGNSRWREIGY